MHLVYNRESDMWNGRYKNAFRGGKLHFFLIGRQHLPGINNLLERYGYL